MALGILDITHQGFNQFEKSMNFLLRVLGLALLILGLYFVGQNIIFTTHAYPYWWRGIAADASILALMAGIVMIMFLPRRNKDFGWIAIVAGVALVFLSSRAILNPTSLWQFFLSFVLITGGYRMLLTGRPPLQF